MKLEEIRKKVLDLSESDRVKLAGQLLVSLPDGFEEEDDEIEEAKRRSRELIEDPLIGCSWEEIKRSLGR